MKTKTTKKYRIFLVAFGAFSRNCIYNINLNKAIHGLAVGLLQEKHKLTNSGVRGKLFTRFGEEERKNDEDFEATRIAESLSRFAQEHDKTFSLHRFRNGLTFLSAENNRFDLVFLDVDMPVLDGIQTAKRLRERDSQVVLVFITKLFQYAVNGYEYDAADFIIKPLRYPSFSLKMEKLMKKYRQAEGKHIKLKYSGGMKILLCGAAGT